LLVCGDQGDLAEIPASLCVAGAAIALFATTVSNDGIWLTIALLLIGAATLLESTPSWQMSRYHDGSVSSAVVLIAIGSGAAAIALAVVTGAPFGWPIAGALSAGIVGGCAIAHESQLANRATSALLRQAQWESRVDPLTGVLNRRGIEERIDWELARSIRYRHAMSLLLIDLDDFKAINDRFGHAQGDEALRQVAQTIDASIRSIDAAGRFGGEEFLVLLPETDVHGALVVAERIRDSVEEMGLATVSIGVAERGTDLSERAQLVAAADEALYRAKRAGKNRAELAG
jgi:diguanylate cyclase (GGDEF)-like protein